MNGSLQRLWRRWVAVALLCVLAVALDIAWHAVRQHDEDATKELSQTMAVIGAGIQDEIEKALSYGIPVTDLVGVQPWFVEIIGSNPVLTGMALTDSSGISISGQAVSAPLQTLLQQRRTSSSGRLGDWYVLTLPLRLGPDQPPVAWLHLAASGAFSAGAALAFSLAIALAVAALMAMALRQLLERQIGIPLQQTRQALDELVHGRIAGLNPSVHRNPACAVLAALAARLQKLVEANKQVLFKTGEVRAAHFDPKILQDIDALAAPLIERHRLAQVQLHLAAGASTRRQSMALSRHMLLAVAAALMGLALGGYALLKASQDAALRAQLQMSGHALDQAWRATLELDRVRLERVLHNITNNSEVQTHIAEPDPEQMEKALSQTLSALAPNDTRLTLARLDGSVLASSSRPFFDARPDRVLLNHLRGGPAEAAGVWQNQGYGYRSGVARRITTDSGEHWVWLVSQPLKSSLTALAARLNAPVALADARGQPVFEEGDPLVQAWRANQRQGFAGTVAGHAVLLGTASLNSPDQHLLGTLMTSARRSVAVSNEQLGLGLLATVMIVASSLLLLFYVPGLLGPVARGAEKLAALADTGRTPETAMGRLSIFGLQRSIEQVEEQIDAFNTLRRSRDRQGQRQARFIRQQMLQLASRLDEEARTGILADLERIELAGKSGESKPAATALHGQHERDLRLEKIVDEVGILALGFQNLVSRVGDQYQQLDRLVAELREALRVKTQFIALQQELEVARKMQQSILPRAFRSRDGLALEATMLPAKEIGGDFYDFFALDAHHVAMAVADVSGKGVPAALFMAVSRTLLRAVAQFSESPAKCLTRLNDLLAGDNEQMMFVTLFYAVLDTRDGRLVYANAGHNPPYLLRSNGAVEIIASTGDMALAIMEGLDYCDDALVLAAGDSLFLYTDGVTEAFDPVRAMFGQPRLEALLEQLHGLPVAELPDRIIAEVKTFEAGGPQTDDITCLLARYRGQA